MKVLWIIERKNGSILKIVTEENAEPVPGDGAIVKEIPVAVGSKLTTPMAAELGKHDVAVAAKEQ
jgi:hypothetical protein